MKFKNVKLGEEIIDTKTGKVGILCSVENKVVSFKIPGENHVQGAWLEDIKYTPKILLKLFTNEDYQAPPKNYRKLVLSLSKKWAKTNARKMKLEDFFMEFKKVFEEEVMKDWGKYIK